MSTTIAVTELDPKQFSLEFRQFLGEYGFKTFANTYDDVGLRNRFLSGLDQALSDVQLSLYRNMPNALPGITGQEIVHYLSNDARIMYKHLPKDIVPASGRISENTVLISRIAMDIIGIPEGGRVRMEMRSGEGDYRLIGIYEVAVNRRERIPSRAPLVAQLKTSEINRAFRKTLTRPIRRHQKVQAEYNFVQIA